MVDVSVGQVMELEVFRGSTGLTARTVDEDALTKSMPSGGDEVVGVLRRHSTYLSNQCLFSGLENLLQDFLYLLTEKQNRGTKQPQRPETNFLISLELINFKIVPCNNVLEVLTTIIDLV